MGNDSPNLTLEEVATVGLGNTHQKVIQKLIELIQALPRDCLEIKCSDRRPQWYQIDMLPSNPCAAQIKIYLCLDDSDGDGPTPVVVNAGRDIAIDILDIQYNASVPDVVGLFEKVIRAITAGHVRETLFYAGGVLYRSQCWVGICGRPIELDRTNVPKWLSSLRKRRSRETFVYGSYWEAEAP